MKYPTIQGNLFKGIDKKSVRREGFSNLITYIFFSARWLQKSGTLFCIGTYNFFQKMIF